jgi:DMSO/TMAO reductase YedYZ heme-binding membrane subunit
MLCMADLAFTTNNKKRKKERKRTMAFWTNVNRTSFPATPLSYVHSTSNKEIKSGNERAMSTALKKKGVYGKM